jgi:hypothetical protein
MDVPFLHLRDETLRRASDLAEGIIAEALKSKKKTRQKVVKIERVRKDDQT